jgi:hypothetical protein
MRRYLEDVARTGSWAEKVRESAYWLFDAQDKLQSTIIWTAAYRDALRVDGVDEARASEIADVAVRSSLPTFNTAEQPTMLRNKHVFGGMLMFYSYFSKLSNMMRQPWHEVETAFHDGGTLYGGASVAKALGQTLAIILVANVGAELLSGRGPEDDEEIPEWVVRKVVSAPGALVPIPGVNYMYEIGAGALSSLLFHGEVRKREASIRAHPAASIIEKVLREVKKIADDEKEPVDKILALALAVGIFFKLPIGSQFSRTVGYATSGLEEDLSRGDVEDIASGLIYGERDDQPANPITILDGRR